MLRAGTICICGLLHAAVLRAARRQSVALTPFLWTAGAAIVALTVFANLTAGMLP